MNQAEYVAILRENRFLRSREECVLFDNTVIEMPTDIDPSLFPELFLIFEDNCEHHEVMWTLMQFLEICDEKLYTDTLIDMTPKMLLNASEWCHGMHCRLHNSATHRKYYWEKLQLLSQIERNIIKDFLLKVYMDFDNSSAEDTNVISPTQTRLLETIHYIDTLANV